MRNKVHQYIKEGEHQQQDFKHSISSSKKIAITLSAFANTDGGRLLIGVKDSGRISGVRAEEEFYMIEAAAAVFSKPEVEFTHEIHNVEGAIVLEINIPESKQKPHYAKTDDGSWMAFIRIQDENYLSDPILVQLWKDSNSIQNKFIKYEDEDKQLLDYLASNPGSQYKHIVAENEMPRGRIIHSLAKLLRWEVLDYEVDEGGIYYYLKD